MKSIIVAAILVVCAASLFTVKNYALGLLFVAGAVFVFLRGRKKKAAKQTPPPAPAKPAAPRPAPAASPAEAPQPSPYEQRKARAGSMHFKIAGVTFEDRQTTLQRIDDMEEDYTACTYGIALSEYEGKAAFKIYATLSDDDMTEKVLGFVPSDLVKDVLPIYDNIFGVEVEVYGGYDGKNYGAAATLYYDR